MLRTAGVVLVALALFTLVVAFSPTPVRSEEGAGAAKDIFPKVPAGWSVTKSSEVAEEDLPGMAEKLGAEVSAITNTVFDVSGVRVQVNCIECPSPDDARTVHAAISKTKTNPACCLLRGTRVSEFISPDMRLILQAPFVLGLRPSKAVYSVSFAIAPVDKCDYQKSNKLSNAFIDLRKRPDDQARRDAVSELLPAFTFGGKLALRSIDCSGKPVAYEFTPEFTGKSQLAADVSEYTFGELPKSMGAPFVKVTATVATNTFSAVPTKRASEPGLLAETVFWPSKDAEVAKLAGEITEGKTTVKEKTEALLDWLRPGVNIKFGGPIVGSRYGVSQVLKQKHGHCWDFSDLFVTLARASGVPARQVAGWLEGQSGHVWAEVLVPGEGWLQVDPTSGLAATADYIPYFTTETGEMPILYLQMPTIEESRRNESD